MWHTANVNPTPFDPREPAPPTTRNYTRTCSRNQWVEADDYKTIFTGLLTTSMLFELYSESKILLQLAILGPAEQGVALTCCKFEIVWATRGRIACSKTISVRSPDNAGQRMCNFYTAQYAQYQISETLDTLRYWRWSLCVRPEGPSAVSSAGSPVLQVRCRLGRARQGGIPPMAMTKQTTPELASALGFVWFRVWCISWRRPP